MDQKVWEFISSIVSGLITNGVQGIYNYITQETLQDSIVEVIEVTKKKI